MPRILFSFTVDTETGEVTVAGNVSVMEALGALQQIAIPLAVQQQMAMDKLRAEQEAISKVNAATEGDQTEQKEVENAVTELPKQGES